MSFDNSYKCDYSFTMASLPLFYLDNMNFKIPEFDFSAYMKNYNFNFCTFPSNSQDDFYPSTFRFSQSLPNADTFTSSCATSYNSSAVSTTSYSDASNTLKKGDILFGHRITSLFGHRKAPTKGASTNHKGIDLAYYNNENVYSLTDGTVVNVVNNHRGYGNYVDVQSSDGTIFRTAHFNKNLVKVGDTVTKSTVIGLAGSTGISTGPHVHWEVIKNGQKVNPLNYA